MFDSTSLSRRKVLIAASGLAAAPWPTGTVNAADAAATRYAVLSIIGDKINLVGYRAPIGSSLDTNDRRVIPVSAPVLDNSALLAVDDAVRRLQPGAATTLLASRDPKLFALQDAALDNPGDAAESVAAIKALAQQAKATRLILLAPYRSEARFQMRHELVGSGRIAGLGFYVDRVMRVVVTDSGEEGTGYLAPFAYFSISLIDAGTMTTIRRKVVTESQAVPTAATKAATQPWDALTNGEKVQILESLIRQGVDRVLPELIGA